MTRRPRQKFIFEHIVTTDAKILLALRSHPDGVSGAQLAEQLKISRAAVWARIEDLRRLGYDIEAGPHLGYRLIARWRYLIWGRLQSCLLPAPDERVKFL